MYILHKVHYFMTQSSISLYQDTLSNIESREVWMNVFGRSLLNQSYHVFPETRFIFNILLHLYSVTCWWYTYISMTHQSRFKSYSLVLQYNTYTINIGNNLETVIFHTVCFKKGSQVNELYFVALQYCYSILRHCRVDMVHWGIYSSR